MLPDPPLRRRRSRAGTPTGARSQPWRLARGGLRGDRLALIPNGEAPVHVFPDLNPSPCQRAIATRRQQLHTVLAQAHRLVAAHGAYVAKATDLPGVSPGPEGAPRGIGVGWRHGDSG